MQKTEGLEPPKRNKQLTQKQIKHMKTNIQKLNISSKHTLYYCIVTKDSKTGFFSNDRLLILNTKEKSLSYISKLPQGLLPFKTEEEANLLKFKSKVKRQDIVKNQINNFKCSIMQGKISTFIVSFSKNKEEEQWIVISGNTAMRNQLVELINKVLLVDELPDKTQEEFAHKQWDKAVEPTMPLKQDKSKPLNQQMDKVSSQRARLQQNKPYQRDYDIPPYQNNNNSLNIQNKISQNNQHSRSQPFAQSIIVNLPYHDISSQIKYLKSQKPHKFNMSNDLSIKKLPTPEESYQNHGSSKNIENSNNFIKERGSKQYINHQEQPISQQQQVESRYLARIQSLRQNKQTKIPSKFIKIDEEDNERYPIQRVSSSKIVQDYEVQPYKRVRSHVHNFKPKPQVNEYDRPYVYQQRKQIENSKVKLMEYNLQPYSSQSQFQINHVKSQIFQQDSHNMINHQSRSKVNLHISSNSEYQQQKQNIILKNTQSNSNIRPLKNNPIPKQPQLQKNTPSNENLYKKPISKVNSKDSYDKLNRNKSFNNVKWNEMFCQSNNRLEVYEDFIHTSYNIVRQIINQLPIDDNHKSYLPIQVNSPFFTYYSQGIIITLHYFQNSNNLPTYSSQQNAPLLYNQETYQILKRQFYNYNLILSVTGNEEFIKVPLCSYFQYKGLIALCKAEISQNFSQITPKRFEKHFQSIQQLIHLKFMYGSFNAYMHPNNKYIIVYNMRQLIPEVPVQQNKHQFYYRKQFLINYKEIIEDLQTNNDANYYIIHQILPEFVNKLQSLQTYVVSSTDLKRICHQNGISLGYIPNLIHQTKSIQIKKIFITELVSSVFVYICRSQINHLYANFPLQNMEDLSLQVINRQILDNYHALIELMFGYSNSSENIWRLIIEQCGLKHKVIITKDDVIPGYLLSSIIEKLGLVCNFRDSKFDKYKVKFFIKSDNIPKDLFVGLKMCVRRYDLGTISPLVKNIQQILFSQPKIQNFNKIISLLDLNKQPIPDFLQNYEPQILSYLCNYVPYSQRQQFDHLGIYNMIVMEPHSNFSIKLSLLAIKWCIKKQLIDQALKIYEMKEVQNAFWCGEFNVAISQFFDFFSMYYASVGKYENSIQLAKFSIKNIAKILGANELPIADKYYQIGNIYFKMGRKQDALKQYMKTKDILMAHNQTHITQFAIILLKIAALYLNFGKINQCINNCVQALRIFDQTQTNQENQIGTFQILSRCYQIAKKDNQHIKIGEIVAEKFNHTQNAMIYTRMAKIAIYIRIKTLSSVENKSFSTIITKLQDQNTQKTFNQCFTFFHRKSQTENVIKKIIMFLDNITVLYEQAYRKDLFRKYKSLDLNTKTQAQQMLVLFDALGCLIGFNFLIGSLKDYE